MLACLVPGAFAPRPDGLGPCTGSGSGSASGLRPGFCRGTSVHSARTVDGVAVVMQLALSVEDRPPPYRVGVGVGGDQAGDLGGHRSQTWYQCRVLVQAEQRGQLHLQPSTVRPPRRQQTAAGTPVPRQRIAREPAQPRVGGRKLTAVTVAVPGWEPGIWVTGAAVTTVTTV